MPLQFRAESVNIQKKLTAEMGIHFIGFWKTLTSPRCGCSPRSLLSFFIVANAGQACPLRLKLPLQLAGSGRCGRFNLGIEFRGLGKALLTNCSPLRTASMAGRSSRLTSVF